MVRNLYKVNSSPPFADSPLAIHERSRRSRGKASYGKAQDGQTQHQQGCRQNTIKDIFDDEGQIFVRVFDRLDQGHIVQPDRCHPSN